MRVHKTRYLTEFRIPADVSHLKDIRTEYVDFLLSLGMNDKQKEAWKLVFSEAVNNAIEHGSQSDPEKTVWVKWWVADTTVWLEVQDEGQGPPEEKTAHPQLPEDPFAESGRGLFIIHEFADTYEHWRNDQGYIARIAKRYQRLNDVVPQNEEMKSILDELSDCYESLSFYDRMAGDLIKREKLDQFVQSAIEIFLDARDYDAAHLELLDPHETQFADLTNIPAYQAFGTLTPEGWRILEENDALSWHPQRGPSPFSNASAYPCGACVPITTGENTLAILAVAYEDEDQTIVSHDLSNLRILSDIIGTSLSQSVVEQERDIRKRLATEISIATKLQHQLLPSPKHAPAIQGFDLFVESFSALDIAGDFVEVRAINEDEYIGCIIDVMGKGATAAILAGIFRCLFITFGKRAHSVEAFVTWANETIATQLGDATMFITAFVFKLDCRTNTMSFVSAGHPPGLLFKQDGGIEELLPSGPPLGLFEGSDYTARDVALRPGERIVLVTDGLYEWTRDGEMFGIDAMTAWFEERKHDPAPAIWNELQEEIQTARKKQNIEQEDDETILILTKDKP